MEIPLCKAFVVTFTIPTELLFCQQVTTLSYGLLLRHHKARQIHEHAFMYNFVTYNNFLYKRQHFYWILIIFSSSVLIITIILNFEGSSKNMIGNLLVYSVGIPSFGTYRYGRVDNKVLFLSPC